jgi:hypothetical protein
MEGSDQAPAGVYEPDETGMEALFARPARQAIPERVTFAVGHAFNGIPAEEADRLRWANLHRRPVRVKEET